MRRGVIVACVFILAGALAPRAAQAAEAGWVIDKRTGCKVCDQGPDPNDTITWSGRCENGMAQGPGVLEWTEDNYDVSKAVGEGRDGKMNGHGVVTWVNGACYEGEFRDDLKNGPGVWKSSKGDRFEGVYLDDLRTGHGVEIFANGNRFEGEYRGGKSNGRGVYTLASGEVFDGLWTNGCFSDGNRWAAIGVDPAACHH